MSYYTSFNLEVRSIPTRERYVQLTDKLRAMQIVDDILTDDGYSDNSHDAYYGPEDIAKWYDYEEDMIKISRLFPEMTFKLSGHGEDVGDQWFELFKDGETEYCEAHVVFDEPKRIEWGPDDGEWPK